MEIKIVVCGDSYCSADTSVNRWHFSQILEDQHGYTITNLARGGMSNTGICFQIKQAIALKPDVIIYNMADPSRIDIPIKPYLPPAGLKNFIYPFPEDSSTGSEYVGASDAAIFSTVYQLIDKNKHINISNDKIQAIKHYHAHLFDWQFRYETDSWILNYWNQQAKNQGILTIFLGSPHDLPLSEIAEPAYNFVKKKSSISNFVSHRSANTTTGC